MAADNVLGLKWFDANPGPIDILLSHGPAYGLLDVVGERLTGSQSQHQLIKETTPALQICGHIHEGQGAATFKETKFINVSLVDAGYNSTDLICEINWPSLEINWLKTTIRQTV